MELENQIAYPLRKSVRTSAGTTSQAVARKAEELMEEVDDDVSSKGDNVPLRFRRTKKYVQNKQFGEYIKKERKKRRLTQFDVAEALQRIMGDVVSNTRIQRYESGARFCDYATALKLAEAIGIPEYEMVANWVSAYGDMQGMGAEGQYILTAYAALPPEAKVKFIEMVESIQELPDPDRISMLKMLIAFQNTIAPDISSIRRRG